MRERITVGVPCSKINLTSEVPCTREDEAVAFAAGASLAGVPHCTVFMQNAGLGNSIDVITSLLKPYGIRIRFIISLRDWPEHHRFMGIITEEMIKLLQLKVQLGKSSRGLQGKLSSYLQQV